MNDTKTTKSPASGVSTSPAPQERASILLVDDKPAQLLSYEAVLFGLGVHFVKALSAREALERLQGQEFAAILLDVSMPEMDGFELARIVRQNPRFSHTPIIFVTGLHITELDQLRGYEVGAVDYMQVPVVPEILRSKVAVLVELYQRRQELQSVNAALAEAHARLSEQTKVLAQRDAQIQAIFELPSELALAMEAERDQAGAITDWIYRNANAGAHKVLGFAQGELIGRRVSALLPDRLESVSHRCKQVLETREPVRYESSFAGRDYLVTLFPGGKDMVVSSGLDITERKQADAALRASEARYRALVDNSPVGVAHNALDGRFQYVNDAFCRLVGYTAQELAARTWQEITHPDDLHPDQSFVNRLLSGDLPFYTLDKRYLRKDGAVVWVELFGSFVFDDEGRAVHSVAVALDITERKRAEIELRESRERLLLAKAAARLGTHDWNVITGMIQWDERTCELWGVDPGEPVTFETFRSGVHPDDWQHAQDAVDKAVDPAGDGQYFATYRVRNRIDGVVRWIEATGRVFFEDGRAVRLVGTVQDVTEREVAGERLRQSEERFRELANSIDQFAWTCDELGQATWYNDRWYEYTGSTLAEMIGEGWKKVHHPDHVDRVAAHLHRCLQTGQPWEDTFPLRSKDGHYRWFLSRAIPIRAADGRIIRWSGTNTDVTELRMLQEALEQEDRRKNEFLAMLAHELRNPVAPIRTAADVLSRLPAHDTTNKPMVAVIQRQTQHLERLLEDLLDVARVTQGRIDLQRDVVTVQSCIDLGLEAAEALIREKGHRLTVSPLLQPLHVNVDRVRIAQSLANVLINAAKYTPPGGEIRVSSFAEANAVVVEITDTGIGISAEFLPRVFDLFAQNERSLDRAQGGLGVGLAVCKQLVEMHGGSIVARSAGLGRGATFLIRLPSVQKVDAPAVMAIAARIQSRRVLVVDDNKDAADSLTMLLQIEGHESLAVYSGEHALQQVLDFAPEFMLLDIGLPGMDGYEVARRVRVIAPSVRIIAVSGYGTLEDKMRSAAAGIEAHLVKPVGLQPVLDLLAVDA
ncbi:MAG TPA: PAS domain S-box protein [Burkholderiales bacterium]